jgi:signal transduction histidine kinase
MTFKRGAILIATMATCSVLFSSIVIGAPYGSGTYGECDFGISCEEAQPINGTDPLNQTNNKDVDEESDSEDDNLSNGIPGLSPTNRKPPQNDTNNSKRFTSDSFGGVAYSKTGTLFKDLHPFLSGSIPYLLFLLVLILILRLTLQARREIYRATIIISTRKKETALYEEKRNFMVLTSHYLRTPITIIKGDLEFIQTKNESLSSYIDTIFSQIDAILNKISFLLKNVEKKLSTIGMPTGQIATRKLRTILSPLVILPILIILVLVVVLNFILLDFRVLPISIVNIVTQTVLAILVMQLYVSTFRKRQINIKNRLEQTQLLEDQRDLDEARSNFVTESANQLEIQVGQLGEQLEQLGLKGADINRSKTAYRELREIINKFRVSANLQIRKIELQKKLLEIDELLATELRSKMPQVQSKGLKLHNNTEKQALFQDETLIKLILNSLLDNAIKFSPPKGEINIKSEKINSTFSLSIEDQGKGVSKEDIERLFKPFMRTESADVFNTPGLGFSLYLDRLIAHYLGGEIELNSEDGNGAHAIMELPISH